MNLTLRVISGFLLMIIAIGNVSVQKISAKKLYDIDADTLKSHQLQVENGQPGYDLYTGEWHELMSPRILRKTAFSTDVEVRHPIGNIWEQTLWPNPQINFFPSLPTLPAGDLYGDGQQNVIIRTVTPDERDDDISTITGKTLVYSANQDASSPDYVVYDYLTPIGDMSGSGMANLYSPESQQIYEFDGGGFTETPGALPGQGWEYALADFDGDGKDDAYRFTDDGAVLEILFGDSDLNNLIIEQYDLQELLNIEGVNFEGKFRIIKDHFNIDGSTYLMVHGLDHESAEGRGRYLLFVSIDSNRGVEFHQFFKYSEFWPGNEGNFFTVDLAGEAEPYLVFSHPFEDDPNHISADELEHLTYLFAPSDDPDILFSEERIPLYNHMVNKLGDLNGDGSTDLVVTDADGQFFLGSIDPGSNEIVVGDKLNYQDERNLNYNIVSDSYYGDLTGNGFDDFRFHLRPADVGGVLASGSLMLSSAGGEIQQSEVVFPVMDYQGRVARNVFALDDITGNGVADFAVFYRIGFASNELAFHEGGTNWDTPFQVWELPGSTHVVQDATSGNFTDTDRRDLAIFVTYSEEGEPFRHSEIWLVEGGANISEDPYWVLDPKTYMPGLDESDYNNFFTTMENVGDVNNSGYDDLLLGDDLRSTAPAGLFLGGSELSDSGPDITFTFEDAELGNFGVGRTLKGLGDISGNGIDDFAIGNISEDISKDGSEFGVNAGGRIHVYYGNEDADFSNPDFTLRSDTLSLKEGYNMWMFGFNEIAVGDFNNDGVPQIAAKALRNHTANSTREGVPGIHVFDPDSSQPEYLIPQLTELYATNTFNIEFDYVGFMGRMQMTGVMGGNGDDLLTIGTSIYTNAVLYRAMGEDNQLSPHTVFMAPNQRFTMGSPGNFVNRHYRTPLGDFTGDGELNFITVQRQDRNYRDSPVYMYAIEGSTVSAEAVTEVPAGFKLEQNYPNPFNPNTMIGFQLPENSPVRLEVFDLLGRRVATLIDGNKKAGRHEVQFEAGHLASGVYLYRLQAGSFTQTKRLTLFK